MDEDSAARAMLDQVVLDWNGQGVLRDLSQLTATVWWKNLDRFESVLGDDAVTLGVQSSRNVCNLAVSHFQGVDGVTARKPSTLELSHQGRVLHISKARSRTRGWDPHLINWAESEVRMVSAEANSKAYMPAKGTLFETYGPLPGQPNDPALLKHLHLLWQGFDDGSTRSWVGFPRLGNSPWYAVALLGDNPGRGATRLDPTNGPLPVGPGDFDALGEPPLSLARRTDKIERDGRSRPAGA
ncbi:hypothetical protein [Pseudonocardia sp. KRD291]|uniref:hypothetical protein n=1 Tax=Pseudonocardia sp. KRD291 TaxID=2792007 RepID=UPI001C4A660B|nr:hypothetical protein [Pseudonocardia sp. KRD291]MBW0106071.1 hypothetical protein [Pseudonocardia sp. KRD291]